MNSKTIIGLILLVVGISIMYLSLRDDRCDGLTPEMCSLADGLYEKHKTPAVYQGIQAYQKHGAKPSGETSSLFDVQFKDVVSFVKTAKGLL